MVVVAGDASPDATLPDASWLARLPEHPIYTPPPYMKDATSTQQQCCMAVRHADVVVAFGNELRMASLLKVKHSDTSAAAGNTSMSGSLIQHQSRLSYQRLTSSVLNFDIARLVVNPTGTLVACVGTHKIAVVVLPRPGALSSRKTKGDAFSNVPYTDSAVKAALVGPYYHHERVGGKARLADVQWHPWGELGSSLLVMNRDGTLREYNVAHDIEEPAQTVSVLSSRSSSVSDASTLYRNSKQRFKSRSKTPVATSRTPERSRRSTSKIAFDDDSASDEEAIVVIDDDDFDESFYTAPGSVRSNGSQGRTVVAFTLGLDVRATTELDEHAPRVAADWTPLSLYALCSNGDLYALCPFMPASANLPFSYLHSLASYVGLSRSASVSDFEADNIEEDLALRFVSALLKEASMQRRESVRASTPQRPRRSVSSTPMSIDEAVRSSTGMETEDADMQDDLVSVHKPSQAIVPNQLQPQGPFLLAPAPHELSDEREPRATDVAFCRLTRNGQELNVVSIASDDGRVDVCLALDPIKPSWPHSTRATRRQTGIVKKSGRYALSDSSDDEVDESFGASNNQQPSDKLPSLIVYESIDLDLVARFTKDASEVDQALRQNPVRITRDPLYPDVLYVSHVAGAHAIGLASWANEILDIFAPTEQTGANDEQALQRVLHRGTSSDVAFVVSTIPQGDVRSPDGTLLLNPMRDVCIVSDIYLCYSFLALSQCGTLVALELNLRVDDVPSEFATASVNDAADTSLLQTAQQAPPAYTSLLGDGPPFTPPEPFKSFKGFPAQPRTAVKVGPNATSEIQVTPESLRALATTVERMRGQMREIVQGANAVQSRLELQMEELKRQLGKLDQANRRIDARRAKDGSEVQTRIARIFERQESIAKRSDRVLQRLIESHSPGLSVYEQRWLEELERLQSQVGKKDGQDSKGNKADTGAGQKEEEEEGFTSMDSLSSRVQALRYHLDMLKPELERAQKQSAKGGASQAAASLIDAATAGTHQQQMGTKQLRQVEDMLAKESRLLALDREKVLHLNALVQRQLRAGFSAS